MLKNEFNVYILVHIRSDFEAHLGHYALTNERSYQIERIQKLCTLSPTFLVACHTLIHLHALFCKPDTLTTGRNVLSQKFFLDITQPSSCLHYIFFLPQEINPLFRVLGFPRVYTREGGSREGSRP